MTEPHPMLYTDGGGTRPVVVEPGAMTDRVWWGPSPCDFFDVYTAAGRAWLHPAPASSAGAYARFDTPIGSRFD